MQRFAAIFLAAGVVPLAVAVVFMAVLPHLELAGAPLGTAEEVAPTVLRAFEDLEARYPQSFHRAFPGGATLENAARALRQGRDVYVAEGCWHCHSQQVRPVGGDRRRWGAVSYPREYHNELQLPPLPGTRRVGPDLWRRGGVYSNDWHAAHLYDPRSVSPTSVMPSYPWFFEQPADGGVPTPNERGLSIITYVQWLGSWIPQSERTSR